MLVLDYQQIADLTPLAELPLEYLSLTGNQVSDLSPLAGMTGLQVLDLGENPVRSAEGLSGLPGLREVTLEATGITSVEPFRDSGIRALNVRTTWVRDYTPLETCPELTRLVTGSMPEGAAETLAAALCACSGTQDPGPAGGADPGQAETVYEYQLTAGEPAEVYDVTFDQMVTVTVDPKSARDSGKELRSEILFDNCAFNGGLTIVGDYHAMITLGSGCSFGAGSTVTHRAVSPDAARETVLEDNLVKLLVLCQGVSVETEGAMGVLSGGPDITVNGTAYSKSELAPETDILGIYSLYEGETQTVLKLAIGNDDSVEFLE